MNTSQVMERQTLRNAPNVDMSRTMAQLGGQGGINKQLNLTMSVTDTYHG
ncbi:MAG TPA: hypothetical protein VJ023_04685 [Pyrinomonadaceae bacterium]|nr:hypothetical protein [Pyrinomonadaceae bacterium]